MTLPLRRASSRLSRWNFLSHYPSPASRGICLIPTEELAASTAPLDASSRTLYSTMSVCETVTTKQPKLDAQSKVHLHGRNTILWDQCRLIWDSSSLVSSTATSSQVSVFGAQGTLVTEYKEQLDFMLRLNYDFGRTQRYSIRVTTAPSDGGSVKTTDLLYSDGEQEDAKAAFEKDVHEMTAALDSNDMEQALKAVLGG